MEGKKLEILVVEDKPEQQARARMEIECLLGEPGERYELDVAGSFDEALDYLGASREEIRPKRHYDVVLSDLMMPASKELLSPEQLPKFEGMEMPYGYVVALLAQEAGVRYIGIHSDMSHHEHPMSYALDMLLSARKIVFSDRKEWGELLSKISEIAEGSELEGLLKVCPPAELYIRSQGDNDEEGHKMLRKKIRELAIVDSMGFSCGLRGSKSHYKVRISRSSLESFEEAVRECSELQGLQTEIEYKQDKPKDKE